MQYTLNPLQEIIILFKFIDFNNELVIVDFADFSMKTIK